MGSGKDGGVLRDFYLGFIKIHILYHAGKEPVYGKEFRAELKRHGYAVSFGTLYPVFHKLEKNGYLRSLGVTVKGKVRKYYSITPKGRKVLTLAKQRARELVNEISGDGV